MPQTRICPDCKKILQIGEVHACKRPTTLEFVRCNQCGTKYRAGQGHICPTMIK